MRTATQELAGRTLGVIGFGNVGKAVAAIGRHGFGLSSIANSRDAKSLPDDVRFAAIDELVAEADIVVLCCPLTPLTTGLISRERIRRMRPGSILVNVSRGAVVDDSGADRGAARGPASAARRSTSSSRSRCRADHPYFSFDNVIVTPHMAGITEQSMMRMGVGAAGRDAARARQPAAAQPAQPRGGGALSRAVCSGCAVARGRATT